MADYPISKTGAQNYVDLGDTPGAMGTALYLVRVNAAGTALEYVDPSSVGVLDHGNLTGLTVGDDHTQYHTDARGDLRYSLLGHTHTASNITDFNSSVDSRIGLADLQDLNNVSASVPGAGQDQYVLTWDDTAGEYQLKINAGALVSSVHSRTGAVVSADGDYTASQITNVPAGNVAGITVQAAIDELDTEKSDVNHNHDTDYISVVATPTAGNFPKLTAGGELVNSTYDETSFAAASHTHLESDITDLQNYSLVGHSHVASDTTDFSSAVDTRIGLASIDALSDVDTSTAVPNLNEVLTWDGANWAPAVNSAGGDTIQFSWKFSSATTASDPGNGKFSYNNSTPASITEIYVNQNSNDSQDLQTILTNIVSGDRVFIQQGDDHTKFLLATLTADSVDNTGWFTLTVSIDDSGTIPDNNKVSGWIMSFSGSIEHSNLQGLTVGDDHTQYHNDSRGDARYYTQTLLNSGQLDNRYYTETEIDTNFSAIGHVHEGTAIESTAETVGKVLTASGSGTSTWETPDSVISAHSGLTGLGADDHTQYSLVDGTRAYTGVVSGITPTADAHLATKLYVDDALATASPGGIDSQIQYNNNGVMGGDAAMTFDDASKLVSFGGDVSIIDSGAELSLDSTANLSELKFKKLGSLVGDVSMEYFNNSLRVAVSGSSSMTLNRSNNADIIFTGDASPNTRELITIKASGLITSHTTNYETLVLADDDIPNKKYVDDAITAGGGSAAGADREVQFNDNGVLGAISSVVIQNTGKLVAYNDFAVSSASAGVHTTTFATTNGASIHILRVSDNAGGGDINLYSDGRISNSQIPEFKIENTHVGGTIGLRADGEGITIYNGEIQTTKSNYTTLVMGSPDSILTNKGYVDQAIAGTTATATTTDATITTLHSEALASGTTGIFDIMVSGREDATGDSIAMKIGACASNQGGTSTLVGGLNKDVYESAGAAPWDITVDVDDTTNTLRVRITGEAAHTIDWKATLTKTEV